MNQVVPTKYWHRLADERIQCDLCPRFCKLKKDQRGACFVRASDGTQIVLTTYGRSSGFCIDPIEKKPLNHFLPGTSVLSFGTAGCNLACKFCQNWDITKSREMDVLADSATPEILARAAKNYGCQSIAYTYNDPTVFMEYAIDVAKACHKVGVKSVAVTAGYITEAPRAEFYQHLDAVNVDLKAFTESFYQKLTGAHLQVVLDSLCYIKQETTVWLEITNLLIPGENDSPQEIDKMTRWIVDNLGPDVPLHFSAFHPAWRMMNTPPTPPKTLQQAREIGLQNGLRYVYVGNIHDQAGDSTYCHQCGRCVIARDWYVISTYHLTDTGRCLFCDAQCAGCFNGPAGDWGAQCQPIRLSDFDQSP